MKQELEYYYEMDDLYQSINNCIDLLEETVGTCHDKKLLPLLEEAYATLEQLSEEVRKYEKN